MKIIADENIPEAVRLFSKLGTVELKPGRHMTADDLEGADALLVRSVTKVNQALLSKSKVKFVGTCTIGTDHLDREYLNSQSIAFSSAPGCNANAVVQYVITALSILGKFRNDLKVGVVGCGNVGGRLLSQLSELGFSCVGVDPNKTRDDVSCLTEFSSIYDCDIVSVHTPLVKDGETPTVDLFAYEDFVKMKPGALLINAGRGECVSNSDLLRYLKTHEDLSVVLDVWNDEPNVDTKLFDYVKIGTPHIAGYSYEGRLNGSKMIFRELALHLGYTDEWIDKELLSLDNDVLGEPIAIDKGKTTEGLGEIFQAVYPIVDDHKNLKNALSDLPDSFDLLRKHYPFRREFSHYKLPVTASDKSESQESLLALGFIAE